MLKSMSSILMLVILCGGLQLSHGEKLKCEFKNISYFVFGDLYSCFVTSLDNSFDNVTIDGYTGVHKASKNDKDVKGIWIDYKNTKYIPHGLGSISSLSALLIDSSQLVEIRSKDFQGMQNLEYLSLDNNKLTSVPSNTFSFLPKLKFIYLNFNQLSEVPSGLFTNNVNLEEIQLFGNHIKFLGTGVFGGLKKLNIVDLQANICEINQSFNGTIEIEELKNQLNSKCKNPNDPQEIIIKLKHQINELIKDKDNLMINDALKIDKDVLLKNYDALQKEKNILMINYDVLTQDKDALKMIIDTLLQEKDLWIKENDELKLKLNNKTKDINELNDKLQTYCNPIEAVEALDVKMNVINAMVEQLLKASKEHQIECQEIIKLREELETAKDQQKTEENEKDQLKKQLIKDKEAMEEEKNLMKTELKNKITEINEFNEKNDKCNKELTTANDQLSHHHDSANVGRRLK